VLVSTRRLKLESRGFWIEIVRVYCFQHEIKVVADQAFVFCIITTAKNKQNIYGMIERLDNDVCASNLLHSGSTWFCQSDKQANDGCKCGGE
jgi:hypothetical protein